MSQAKLFVGTGNDAKLAELESLCQDLPIQILSPVDLSEGLPEVEENGESFLDNAALKALAFAEVVTKQLGQEVWALADDSGLCVDALDGDPGIHSARWAGIPEDRPRPERDKANNEKLLQELKDTPPDQRGAAFWCVIAVAKPEQLLFAVEGNVRGRILESPEGEGGFGYDPLFYHEASGCSFAHLNAAAKAEVSHRGEAIARLQNVLQQVLPS